MREKIVDLRKRTVTWQRVLRRTSSKTIIEFNMKKKLDCSKTFEHSSPIIWIIYYMSWRADHGKILAKHKCYINCLASRKHLRHCGWEEALEPWRSPPTCGKNNLLKHTERRRMAGRKQVVSQMSGCKCSTASW